MHGQPSNQSQQYGMSGGMMNGGMNHQQHQQHRYNNNYGNSNGRNHSNYNNGRNGQSKGHTKDTWISPFKHREQNINFFMYAYKCQACHMRRNCPSKVTCPGWHHEGEKRRNPGEHPNYLYSEEPCPHVKPQGSNKWQPPSRCPDKDECAYSHTLLEQMYHPNIYKTSMCINFTNPKGNKCQWGFYCTHAHGQDDIRNPKDETCTAVGTTSNSSSHTDNSPSNSVSSKSLSHSKNNARGGQRPAQRPKSISTPPNYEASYAQSANQTAHAQRQPAQVQNHRISPSLNNFPPPGQGHAPVPSPPFTAGMTHPTDYPSPLPYQVGSHGVPPMANLPDNAAMYQQQQHHYQQNGTGHGMQHSHQQYGSLPAISSMRRRSQSADTGLERYTGPASIAPRFAPTHYQDTQMQMQSNPYLDEHAPMADPNGLSLDTFVMNGAYVEAPPPMPGGSSPPPPTHNQMQTQQRQTTHVQGPPPLDLGPAPPVPPGRRTSYSTDFGNLNNVNNPYLRGLDRLAPEMQQLKHSISGPSKVGDLMTTAEMQNYYVASLDKNASDRRRPRTRSEPSMYKPIPRHVHSAEPDSIWRTASTNPSQSPTDATASKSQKSKLSQKINEALPHLPDGNPTLTSPTNANAKSNDSLIDALNIITPPATDAIYQHFGFSRQEIISPVDQRAKPLMRSRASKRDVDVKSSAAEVERLRSELKAAQTRIEALMKASADGRGDGKGDDDVKDAESESLEQQQIVRYRHFVTCPTCESGKQKTARNRVLIPCGHLVCEECAGQASKGKCPLCDAKIERCQVLCIE